MLLIKYIMQAAIPKISQDVKDSMKREHYNKARRQNSSMRGKRDRRSQSFRQKSGIFFRGDSDGGASPASFRRPNLSRQTSAKSILRNRGPNHQQSLGLMTIPSEEISPSTQSSNSQKDKENRLPAIQNATNAPRSEGSEKGSHYSGITNDSSHFKIPTPRHLPMEAEATPRPPKHEKVSPFSEYIKTAKSFENDGAKEMPDSPESVYNEEAIEMLLNESDDDMSLALASVASSNVRSANRESDSANELALARVQARLSGLESMRLSQDRYEC